ncbi:MAG: MerR family transcriptional regulator [Prevotellaceae bacterium]|nr:MerR family transcriptional regulator [Prevotellaceae bacterium]MCD8304421.1 MerR family transcriptional regulator [Prevotellaceae bacterium]
MSLNTNKDLKKYYSIGEVAKRFGVAESLLRYWEKEFPTIKPRKAGRGVRQYTVEDIDEIGLIYNMVKVRGMKIAAARESLSKGRRKARRTKDLYTRLLEIRAELVSIRKELDEAPI